MTNRKARIFLDEDENTVVASMLRGEGIHAETVSGLGRKSLSDDQQLRFAVENESPIVTHNRVDFEQLAVQYFDNNTNHYGIVISSLKPPREIADELLKVLDRFSADELMNQVIYI